MTLEPTPGGTVITLPDPWSARPWTRRLNSFHAVVSAESSAWIRSYNLYNPSQQRVFDLCDHTQLASLAYPDLNKEQFRVISDYLLLLFAFDDAVERKDKNSAQIMASALMSGLQDGAMPDLTPGTEVWGAMAQDLRRRLATVMPNPTYQHRFVSANRGYTDAVVQEAEDHHHRQIRSIDQFFVLRRGTAALYPLWVLLCMDLDIPAAVFDNPVVKEIEQLAADMVTVCNDMVSYGVESSRDEHHNIVALVKELHDLSLQEAMEWAGNKGTELMAAAENARARIPTFGGDVDLDVGLYVDRMCNWVMACDSWSFDGQRYFGEDTPWVRKSRRLVLHAGR